MDVYLKEERAHLIQHLIQTEGMSTGDALQIAIDETPALLAYANDWDRDRRDAIIARSAARLLTARLALRRLNDPLP